MPGIDYRQLRQPVSMTEILERIGAGAFVAIAGDLKSADPTIPLARTVYGPTAGRQVCGLTATG
jgi:hypothetical protein